MRYLLPSLVSFLLTIVIVPLVMRFATACKCVDIPGQRHIHKKITPRWGGMAFFLGVLPILLLLIKDRAMAAYLIAACILVGIGIIDDRYELGWKVKFAGNIAAATILVFGGNVVVHSIGTYGSLGSIELGWLGIPVTYLGIIGVINAVNMIDGLNGLAGGVSLLAFLFMGCASALSGDIAAAIVCISFVGALAGFLLYNFPDAKIFMGDSGSMFLGFSLAFIAVHTTQGGSASVNPMLPVLVLLLPIFDTLRVMLVRIARHKNPFHGDKSHLHHLLVRKGISATVAVLLLWALSAGFGMMAFVLSTKTSLTFLAFALYASLFLGLFAISLTWRRRVRREGRLSRGTAWPIPPVRETSTPLVRNRLSTQ